ncbi:hypothetical protein GOP47_0012369 [Adiantum capillus-veneris]|uniref:Leucine aminopeptidase n=1 Tax=Adiantum capillus-veneris TaxID=13818 RepID=A0A9D4ZE89_ADICA|nr:hypothetical protein GOP47_0012369 [Adiantum capillus-veneris]
MAPLDPHSYTDSSHPLTKRVDLSLFLDFDSKTILGSATLHLSHVHTGEFYLDTRTLRISSIVGPSDEPLQYTLDDAQPIKGSLLRVTLAKHTSFKVVYATDPCASALQWLDPPQTAGKKLPYILTQCQAIHARSIFPCQDTPLARIEYSAKVNVPKEMKVVMSAAHVGRSAPSSGEANSACEESRWLMEGRIVEYFNMEQTIPPYLFAMAAGDIVHAELSARSRVYTEPCELEGAANEFAGTEAMMQQGEALFGPYAWERLDLLVLPPSFPYGGMENPRMVFLTPTVIVGDKSGVQVVAHELAHSWTGNLITNATNDDFWLNEGFTTYAERRIVEALEGEERACLHIGLGWTGLKEEMERFKERPEFTKLKTNQEGVDPDEIYSQVPYEKGFHFLWRLEAEFGRAAFDDFLKKYISTFRFTSITTETFLQFLKDHFLGIEDKIDLDVWVYQPGIPADAIEPKSTILQRVLALAEGFNSGQRISEEDAVSWQALEWQIYLENLPKKLHAERISELNERFHFSENHNWEIKVAFLTIAAFSGYETCFPAIESALHSVGRMKYLRPLYSGLLQSSSDAKELARRVFADARHKYHPIAQSVVQGLLQKFDQ